MSATIAAEMYQQYFGSPTPPIFVGARRFPIDEFYVEDLQQMVNLPSSEQKVRLWSSRMLPCYLVYV